MKGICSGERSVITCC